MFGVFFVSENRYFAVFVQVSSFPEEEISDYPAYGPIIRVLMVIGMVNSVMNAVSYVWSVRSLNESKWD